MGTINAILTAFSRFLGHTPLNGFVAGVSWVVPTVQVIHILAVAAVMSAIAIINLRALGLIDRKEPFAAVLDRFLPPVALCIPLLALTGLLLIAGEPTRAIFRLVFWTKMALLILASALTFSLRWDAEAIDGQAGVEGGGALALSSLSAKAKVLISTALWLGVVVAGRWIGYASGWPGSPQ